MFYLMYLSNICQRRSWPEPLYEPYRTGRGHFCKVRVNNREYSTDVPYETEALAKDGAAMRAYMIVRNFSHNDGMYPGQRPGQRPTNGSTVQGLPVAIGTGRHSHSNRSSAASYDSAVFSSSDASSSSGGNSPKSIESGFEQQLRQVTQQTPRAPPRHVAKTSRSDEQYLCYCRRGSVRAYGRCGYCLRESGWA